MLRLRSILQSNFFFLFLFLFTSVFCVFSILTPQKSLYEGNETEITGKVLFYSFQEEELKVTLMGKEKIMVFLFFSNEKEKESLKQNLGFGKTIQIHGAMEKPSENRLPNTFNYQEYLAWHHIHYLFYADSIQIQKNASILSTLKDKIVKYIDSFSIPFLSSILLGRKENLDLELYQKNGISHIFAVSGMHFAFFLAICEFFIKKKPIGKIIISMLLFFYAFLVGFTPSVLRVIAWYYAKRWNHTFHDLWTYPKLFAVLLCLFLWIDPFFLFDMGFQYSFLLSFAVFFLDKKKGWKAKLKNCVLLFLTSLPITAIHFYEVNFCSILLNFLLLPILSFCYPLCILVLFLPFLSPFIRFFFEIFETFNLFFSKITFGVLVIPRVFFFWWIVYGGILILLFRKFQIKYLLFLIAFLFLIKSIPKWDFHAYVYFLDVGQGDSALFVSPHQKEIILVDTGGSYGKKEEEQVKNFMTFFHSLGITKLNYLVLTHGDYDHLGNALSLLSNVSVSHIVLNEPDYTSKELEILSSYPSICSHKLESSEFQIQEYTIPTKNDENASSLIYRIQIYSTSFLMMGDATKEIEEKIYPRESDVIKIGHHGSNTSSSLNFLKKVNPQYAVISVGKNSYGHPSKETIETLNKLQIPILETKELHTIIFQISKKKFLLKT